jgi:hypothetical protein
VKIPNGQTWLVHRFSGTPDGLSFVSTTKTSDQSEKEDWLSSFSRSTIELIISEWPQQNKKQQEFANDELSP